MTTAHLITSQPAFMMKSPVVGADGERSMQDACTRARCNAAILSLRAGLRRASPLKSPSSYLPVALLLK
jgi:hypothetical protein